MTIDNIADELKPADFKAEEMKTGPMYFLMPGHGKKGKVYRQPCLDCAEKCLIAIETHFSDGVAISPAYECLRR